MKLVIGKPDDSEIVLAEQAGGTWKPNPNLAAELAARRPSGATHRSRHPLPLT